MMRVQDSLRVWGLRKAAGCRRRENSGAEVTGSAGVTKLDHSATLKGD